MSDYKLVPVEPTPKMLQVWKSMRGYSRYNKYKAMLDAAPDVQGEPIGWRWEAWLGGEKVNGGVIWQSEKPKFSGSFPVVEFRYQPFFSTPQPVEQQPGVTQLAESLSKALEGVAIPSGLTPNQAEIFKAGARSAAYRLNEALSHYRKGGRGMTNHRHYFHKIPSGITEADIYRLIEIIGITCPVAQHVFKKSAAAGSRGHKDLRKDWQDILDSAKRKLEMLDEDDRSKNLDDKKLAMGEAMHSLSGIVLHGHEVDTDFDSEHRMNQIGPNGNNGEHYSFIPQSGLKWIANTGKMPNGLDVRDEVEVIWGRGSRITRDCVGNFAWGLNGGFGDIRLYRVLDDGNDNPL